MANLSNQQGLAQTCLARWRNFQCDPLVSVVFSAKIHRNSETRMLWYLSDLRLYWLLIMRLTHFIGSSSFFPLKLPFLDSISHVQTHKHMSCFVGQVCQCIPMIWKLDGTRKSDGKSSSVPLFQCDTWIMKIVNSLMATHSPAWWYTYTSENYWFVR